jgi:Na+/proline symporter
MSSMDSALNALATTWVVNIRRDVKDPEARLRMTRRATVVLGVLLVGAALACVVWAEAMAESGFGLIDLALGSMTVLYGGLLGAFLVGMATRRGSERSVMIGMLTSGALGLVLLLQPLYVPGGEIIVAWPWWIILGTAVSFGIGVLGDGKDRAA